MSWRRAATGLFCLLVATGCGERDRGGWLPPSDPYGDLGDDDTTTETVEITTSDDKRLNALFTSGDASPPGSPGVLLVHQYLRDASQWGNLPALLANAGFRVLAIDLRGHGASDPYDLDIANILGDPNGAPRDVEAAIAYLSGTGEADNARIGVVGTSIGGSLAIAASMHDWATTYVAISPGMQSSVMLADVAQPTDLESVAYLVAEEDDIFEDCEVMFDLTEEPRTLETYAGADHGVTLAGHAAAQQRVISWLEEQLL